MQITITLPDEYEEVITLGLERLNSGRPLGAPKADVSVWLEEVVKRGLKPALEEIEKSRAANALEKLRSADDAQLEAIGLTRSDVGGAPKVANDARAVAARS